MDKLILYIDGSPATERRIYMPARDKTLSKEANRLSAREYVQEQIKLLKEENADAINSARKGFEVHVQIVTKGYNDSSYKPKSANHE